MQHLESSTPPVTSNQSPVTDVDSEPGPTLLDYLLVLAKYKKMIFVTTFGAAVLTAAISLFLPNIYTAKAMILPADEDRGMMSAMMAQMGGLAAMAGGSLGGPTKTDLYVTMLKSETIKDPIIDRFKLMGVYEVKFRSDAYKKLDKNAVVIAGKKDGVITISVDDRDPKRAAGLANAYVDELGKLAARLNVSGAGKNRIFLEERLAGAKADLVKAEDALKTFQSRNKAISVTEQAKASIEGVAQLRAQLALQEVQLATLQRQFTDSSQEIKTAKASISNLRGQIGRLEGNGSSSSIPSVGSVPQLGQEYVRLMREFKIQETLVELLTKQYEMTRLTEAKDYSPFNLLQKAKTPERKSKPARVKLVLTATFSAFFFSILLSFVRENISGMSAADKQRWKDLSIRSREVRRLAGSER